MAPARARPAGPVRDWLPAGKRGGVVFTIDDVHPGRSSDAYEAGGDLGRGALGHLERLLERHPQLRITLFVTADWREISPHPTRRGRLLARLPVVGDRFMHAPILPEGTMQIDRHPEFVDYLSRLPRTEIGMHGYQHVHPGKTIAMEFQEGDSPSSVERRLRAMLRIFEASGLRHVRGLCPPGWSAPPALLDAMARLGFTFVASARDIRTEVSPAARTAMSGLSGLSLLYPERLDNGLLHIATNFQATSPIERAHQVLEHGGLVAIKGHIIKNALGHVALDGIDGVYTNFLDLLFSELERRYGDSLCWTTPGEIAERLSTAP